MRGLPTIIVGVVVGTLSRIRLRGLGSLPAFSPTTTKATALGEDSLKRRRTRVRFPPPPPPFSFVRWRPQFDSVRSESDVKLFDIYAFVTLLRDSLKTRCVSGPASVVDVVSSFSVLVPFKVRVVAGDPTLRCSKQEGLIHFHYVVKPSLFGGEVSFKTFLT